MKNSRIQVKLWLSLALLAALLLAVPAGAATQGVTPLRASVPRGLDEAVGGTDIFWISQRLSDPEPKIGYSYTNRIFRTSLLDGSKTMIKKFDPTDTVTGFPDNMLAGGGYLYVNMTGDGPVRDDLAASSTVLRMDRDGSNVQKLVHGELNAGEEDSIVVEHGKGRLNDCGTEVAAELVTSDGSVVIRETTLDRDSKACGQKKNVDHVRFYLLSPAGISREIVKTDIPVRSSIHVGPGGDWSADYGPDDADYANVVSVVGDRVLYARTGVSTSLFVRDLNTGAETGPYKTGITGRYPFTTGSLDSLGRVAMSSYASAGSRKHRKFRHASGVFQVPGSAATITPVKGLSFLMFCGDHLLSLTNHGVSELDPVTLNLLRRISPRHKDGSVVWMDDACTNDYLYMSSTRGKSANYLAYPLG